MAWNSVMARRVRLYLRLVGPYLRLVGPELKRHRLGRSRASLRSSPRKRGPSSTPAYAGVSGLCCPGSTRPTTRLFATGLLHHQHRAFGELHDAIGTAPDHPLVERGMAGRPNDEQVYLELGRELDDVADGMAGQQVGMQLDLLHLRHRPRALQHAVEEARGLARRFADFLDEFRQIGNLLDRDHVQLGGILFRDRERQRQRVKGVLRAVVGDQDLVEHRTPSRVIWPWSRAGAAPLPHVPRTPALASAADGAADRRRWRSRSARPRCR